MHTLSLVGQIIGFHFLIRRYLSRADQLFQVVCAQTEQPHPKKGIEVTVLLARRGVSVRSHKTWVLRSCRSARDMVRYHAGEYTAFTVHVSTVSYHTCARCHSSDRYLTRADKVLICMIYVQYSSYCRLETVYTLA